MLQEDISREGPTGEKFRQPFRMLFPANTNCIAKVPRFCDVDIARINEEMGTDIRGVIIDLDETVARHHRDILTENQNHMRAMYADGISEIIFSNHQDTGRCECVSDIADVHYSQYPKPDPRGFEECCKALGLKPDEVMMIGDNLITDGGAIRAGVHMCLVEPIDSGTGAFRRLHQTAPRRFARWMSDRHDAWYKREVYTPS